MLIFLSGLPGSSPQISDLLVLRLHHLAHLYELRGLRHALRPAPARLCQIFLETPHLLLLAPSPVLPALARALVALSSPVGSLEATLKATHLGVYVYVCVCVESIS
jgi:hypothetical protein